MNIQYKYKRFQHSASLESYTHQLIQIALESFLDTLVSINVSFETGKHGNRVRIRADFLCGCVSRESGHGETIKESCQQAVEKLKISASACKESGKEKSQPEPKDRDLYANWSDNYITGHKVDSTEDCLSRPPEELT